MDRYSTISGLFGLLLACVLVMGCGRGTSTTILTITGISPTSASLGRTIEFSAVLSGGTPPYTYSWDFTDVGTSDDATSATPMVLIESAAGTHTIGLTVVDGGQTEVGSFSLEIINDGVTAVIPAEPGLPLATVQFVASSAGTPSALAWDFGAGTSPSTSSDLSPVVVLQNPGSYQGSVTATIDGIAMPPFPFEYEVATPIAPAWKIMRLGDASTQFGWINLIEHQERLTAIYVNNGQLICSRAKVADPQTDVDWDTHIIGSGMIAAHHNVISIDGKLAILYLTEASFDGSALRFAISNTEVPTSASDWTTYALGADFFATPIFGFTLANIDDERIIIAVPQFSDGSGMRIAVSDGPAPTSDADWGNTYLLNKDTSGGFTWPEFDVREEDVLLVTQQATGGVGVAQCRVLHTGERTPDSTEDWEMFETLPSFFFGSLDGAQDIQEWDGKPWVVSGNSTMRLGMWFSADEVPATGSSWTPTLPGRLLDSPALPVGISPTAQRLAVAMPNTSDNSLRVARQVGIDPVDPLQWSQTTVLSYGSTGGITGVCSAIAYQDRIAVAVLTNVGARIAIAQGPY